MKDSWNSIGGTFLSTWNSLKRVFTFFALHLLHFIHYLLHFYITFLYSSLTSFHTAQKMKFSIEDLCSKCDQIHRELGFVIFTEEILNGKLHFLFSVTKFALKSTRGVIFYRSCYILVPRPGKYIQLMSKHS